MSTYFARFRRVFVAVLFVLAASSATAQTATVVGRVYDPQANPVADATVTLVELRRSVKTAADGSFRFDNVPPRHYHLRAESPRLGHAVGEADVRAGETRTVEVVIDPLVHTEEIVVTASADSRRQSEVYQPVTVLAEEHLAARMQPTLGQTLAQEPGVSSTFFGAGSSRPVIRGLGADRVRILEDGVGTGDVANVSPDHAVSVEPSNAEQIEIVRGPATLLYGSNAIGGVVNVISDRIPSRTTTDPLTGTIETRFASAAEEKNNAITLDGSVGAVAWHGSFSLRDTNDYEIPEPADPFDDPEHFDGVLENSSTSARSGSFGASWVGDRGFFGAALTTFKTNYGVPGHAHHDEEDGHEGAEEEEEGVRIDLDQRRVDFRGELASTGIFSALRFRLGLTEYEHVELEGDHVGTRFENEGIEGRFEAHHNPFGRVTGTWGVQAISNDFVARGDEAYIPPNESTSAAVFAFEEFAGERFDVQFGARYEHQHVAVDDPSLEDGHFSGISGSLGSIWRVTDGYVVAASLSRAVRLPTATELFANGPHAATSQFEIGNPDLGEETSLGLDVSLRRTLGRFRGELNLFNNAFDGYIYESPTDEEEDELPVFRFLQRDARFRGVELSTHTHLFSRGGSHVELDMSADYVRATLDGGENLPRIPPMRAAVGMTLHGGPVTGMVEVRHTFEQDDVAMHEETTGGFTFLNAYVGYRFFLGQTIHEVMLRGTNLTDQMARTHVSPIKERAPLPGRDLALSYRLMF